MSHGQEDVHRERQKDEHSRVVRVEGLEPPRLSAPEPKSGASTNFATPAHSETKRLECVGPKHQER